MIVGAYARKRVGFFLGNVIARSELHGDLESIDGTVPASFSFGQRWEDYDGGFKV